MPVSAEVSGQVADKQPSVSMPSRPSPGDAGTADKGELHARAETSEGTSPIKWPMPRAHSAHSDVQIGEMQRLKNEILSEVRGLLKPTNAATTTLEAAKSARMGEGEVGDAPPAGDGILEIDADGVATVGGWTQ